MDIVNNYYLKSSRILIQGLQKAEGFTPYSSGLETALKATVTKLPPELQLPSFDPYFVCNWLWKPLSVYLMLGVFNISTLVRLESLLEAKRLALSVERLASFNSYSSGR